MGVRVLFDRAFEYVLVNYRWVFVVFFLLPVSFCYQLWDDLRSYVVFKLNSAPRYHARKVLNVQKQIKQWRASGATTKLCTARPGWQTMNFRRPLYKNTYTNINVNLVDVLDVDVETMTVRCECLVTMGQLSKALESVGLALPVVPEIDDLTVGGLVMGTGVETSSHVHGLFQHICLEYELVLADGSVVTCSKDNNPDLFYSVPWSYGTLGFLTSVVIMVQPAKKFVRLEYHPLYSLLEISDRLSAEANKESPHQYVEGLLYSENQGVIMLGDMVDAVGNDGKLNSIGEWNKPWFFKHVEGILATGISVKDVPTGKPARVEYIPLRDYFHRHTRSLFWELQDIIPFGNHPLYRNTFGWLKPPKVSLLKVTQTNAVKKLYEQNHIIQDMLVPIHDLKDSIQMFHNLVEVYPIWLCPFKLPKLPGLLQPSARVRDSQMFVDIGVYGVPKVKHFDPVKTTRAIEKFVLNHGGYQMLYADTYTTRQEFRTMFDHHLYDIVRDKLPYAKLAFPEIYDKVCKEARI